MLEATMIHLDHSEVFPFAPGPIRKEDGADKNDCERNAAKRLLGNLRRSRFTPEHDAKGVLQKVSELRLYIFFVLQAIDDPVL